MTSGSITLSGVTEKQVASILEFKNAHEGQFTFDIAAAKQHPNPNPQTGSTYGGVVLSWTNDTGLKLVMELVNSLVSG